MKILSLSAAALSVSLSLSLATPTSASTETVYLGGRWFPASGFTLGYIDAIDGRDTAGDTLGETITFSHTAIFPGPITISLDTPDFGWESFHFTTLATYTTNAAGTFYQLTDSNHDAFAVNLIRPGFGIPSFGLFATFDYTAPPPPPCDDCGPPPPCFTCNPPPALGTPEPSTWLMMFLGFTALALTALQRNGRRDATRSAS